MVVDDDQNIRLALKYRLEKEGYHVLLAEDGMDALDKVKAENPDLIILDLTMPRMDGFGFLKQIRGNGTGTSTIPVIVLTAYGFKSNLAKSLELGAAEFVTKPFSPRQLVAEVWKVLRAKKKRVLIVDDDTSLRDLLAGLLEAEGCVVDTAEDGPSGIEKALTGDYDLIFIDNGISGCAADEAARRIIAEKVEQRIVITTAGTADEDADRALESGALPSIPKPCGIEDVRKIKRELLG
jgi:DNA-binding response OmpR family regulator